MTATSSPTATVATDTLVASDSLSHQQAKPIIVIGSGPVGMRFVQELLQKQPNASLKLFGNEPYAPYNRVQLSSVLAGDVNRDDISYQLPKNDQHPNFQFVICAVKHIDPATNNITDALDRVHDYSQLVIATGSRAFVPSIPGIDQKGVYTFRNLKDTDALYARLSSSKHIVVVGGGLLGIEAARALQRLNTHVTMIHQGSRLMNRQLDDEAAEQLQQKLTASGIDIVVNSGVRVVHGMNRVEAVTTRNGEELNCDTVLFCTGVTCNIELAQAAGIHTIKGIVVDDQLRTSIDNIFAIGECSEFDGQTYGFAGPGLDQAAVAADVIAGGEARYQGSNTSSRLKVVEEQVFSCGEVSDFIRYGRQKEIVFRKGGIYRKLVIQNGKLQGLLGIGNWPELPRIQELYQQQRKLPLWQQWLFKLNGYLWPNPSSGDARHWPGNAIICQCNSVPQSELVIAIEKGCNSLQAIADCTRAGSVCGSCKPLLNQLLGQEVAVEKDKAWLPVLLSSITALVIIALVLWLPGLVMPDSVQESAPLAGIWNDKFWKQVTGFSLLGLSAIGLLMSLRKRINSVRLGAFAYWRALHIVLGLLCAGLLIMHTGFHLGENLNRYLMVDFLLVVSLGAIAGIAVGISHRLSPAGSLKLRKALSWAHLLVSWPLPLLLAMHILSVYYF